MLFTIAGVIIFLYFLHVYSKSTTRFCTSRKRLDGKTVIVTGGTSGIGLQAAKDFANRGARVIIACPFQDEGNTAQKEIQNATGNMKIVFKLLDLASTQSVRSFAADVLETEDRLDILVNNAGVGIVGDFDTKDGMNFIMQVNYYGHFLLTLLLLPLLKKSGTETAKSRIVNVSSITHRIASSDVTKYNKTGYYWSQLSIYSNSKFCFVLFARELSKRLGSSSVVVNCVDPGLAATAIYYCVTVPLGTVVNTLITIFCNTPWEGAQTTLYAALEDEPGTVSGGYFMNCQQIRARPLAYDDRVAELLWRESVRLVGMEEEQVKQLLC